MARLNLWCMTALVATGLLVMSIVLFCLLAQQYTFTRNVALQYGTNLDQSVGHHYKAGGHHPGAPEAPLWRQLDAQPKPFPPGAPV